MQYPEIPKYYKRGRERERDRRRERFSILIWLNINWRAGLVWWSRYQTRNWETAIICPNKLKEAKLTQKHTHTKFLKSWVWRVFFALDSSNQGVEIMSAIVFLCTPNPILFIESLNFVLTLVCAPFSKINGTVLAELWTLTNFATVGLWQRFLNLAICTLLLTGFSLDRRKACVFLLYKTANISRSSNKADSYNYSNMNVWNMSFYYICLSLFLSHTHTNTKWLLYSFLCCFAGFLHSRYSTTSPEESELSIYFGVPTLLVWAYLYSSSPFPIMSLLFPHARHSLD